MTIRGPARFSWPRCNGCGSSASLSAAALIRCGSGAGQGGRTEGRNTQNFAAQPYDVPLGGQTALITDELADLSPVIIRPSESQAVIAHAGNVRLL